MYKKRENFFRPSPGECPVIVENNLSRFLFLFFSTFYIFIDYFTRYKIVRIVYFYTIKINKNIKHEKKSKKRDERSI
jgi:hypothetical protein